MNRFRPHRGRLHGHNVHEKRRAGRPIGFPTAVAGLAAAAFATVFYWPSDDEPQPLVQKFERMLEVRAAPNPVDRFICDVSYVNDGDTLRCEDGTRVRLHAVAARETDETCSPGHPCPAASAASATAELRRLAANRTISCERVGQSYSRVTAICWTSEQVEINCAMIRSGTTLVWERFDRERAICRS